MNAAEGFEAGFEVWLILKDKWTNYLQGYGYGNGDGSRWQGVDNGDGTYTATVPMNGPAPWHQLYTWEFIDGDGTNYQEGGGFGFGRFRARYMCPDEGVWGDWAFPMDVFTIEPPLLVEDYDTAAECLGVCINNGDTNGGGNTDVLDIVAVVARILGTIPLADDVICHADMDNNGSIDILDIVIIIDLILNSGGRSDNATEATINTTDGVVSIAADGVVGGVYMETEPWQ